MIEIMFTGIASSNSAIDKYLKKLIKEIGHESQYIDWEKSELSNTSPLILVTDTENLSDIKNILKNRNQKTIVAFNSKKDFKLVSELKSDFDKVFGFIDLSQELDYNIPILNNYINTGIFKNTQKLKNISSELGKVYELTKSELVKIKDLHDRFVKVRVDQFKGGNFTSKFMAGEKSGGEFFEIIKNDQELLFVQAGSGSYLLSSIILSEIEILKDKKITSNLTTHLDQFLETINNCAVENKTELTYCIMNLNLKTLEAHFTLKGVGYIFYQGEFISFEKPVLLNLKPSERLCILSEGAIKNWELLSKLENKKFFIDNQALGTKNLINEFFFELSRNRKGSFLFYDAMMAAIEIENHILYRIS